jgi:hypothetical protein
VFVAATSSLVHETGATTCGSIVNVSLRSKNFWKYNMNPELLGRDLGISFKNSHSSFDTASTDKWLLHVGHEGCLVSVVELR